MNLSVAARNVKHNVKFVVPFLRKTEKRQNPKIVSLEHAQIYEQDIENIYMYVTTFLNNNLKNRYEMDNLWTLTIQKLTQSKAA